MLRVRRIVEIFFKIVSFQPVFRFRFLPSLFHAFIGWGFLCLLVIDLTDSDLRISRVSERSIIWVCSVASTCRSRILPL